MTSRPSDAQPTASPIAEDRYYRHVAAEVTPCGRRIASPVRFESNNLHSDEPVLWRFRQPEASLFWWDSGFDRYDLEVDGGITRADLAARRPFGLIPPNAEVRGEHYIAPNCTYHVLFIDTAFFEEHGRVLLGDPMIGFSDGALERSIAELSQWRDDATFSLMTEGWALQAIARMQRHREALVDRPATTGGLSGATFRRLDDYIMSRLHDAISLVELSELAGLSIRHLSRAFLAHTGRTPARYVHDRRVELARQMLGRPGMGLGEVARACGFTHPNHFATSFKRATGLTPGEYCRRFHA